MRHGFRQTSILSLDNSARQGSPNGERSDYSGPRGVNEWGVSRFLSRSTRESYVNFLSQNSRCWAFFDRHKSEGFAAETIALRDHAQTEIEIR